MLRKLLLVLFFFIHDAHAYELVMIQATGQKTFITRLGKRQGLIPGFVGTFTAKDVSFLAKAKTITGEFTQWEMINTQMTFPFKKGDIVTFYPATEYLWATAPEQERKKYIKSQIPQLRSSLIFKGSLSRGLQESTSTVLANTPRRGGYLGEFLYERSIWENLHFNTGLRYDREVANYTGYSYETKRSLVLIDLLYYFDSLQSFIPKSKFFLAGGMGYGLSQTSAVTLTQTGPVTLLPGFRAGITLPFNFDWELLLEGSLETLSSREKQESGLIQTTTQTNMKFGLGFKRYLF